jgi:hypothetical protein
MKNRLEDMFVVTPLIQTNLVIFANLERLMDAITAAWPKTSYVQFEGADGPDRAVVSSVPRYFAN